MTDLPYPRSGAIRRRALALVGTAIGGTVALVPQAEAQNVRSTADGNYSLTRAGTISGGPRTVDIQTNNGAITLALDRVEVNNPDTANGAGIATTVTGTGNTAITVNTVAATGAGTTYGIDARAANGNVTIESGAVTSNANNASRGISVLDAGGLVAINAGTTTGAQNGIFTGPMNGTLPAVTRITSTAATASGTGQVAAIAAQGTAVVVNSGAASTTSAGGNGGAAILANAGTGGATVVSGTATTAGFQQAAIQINSAGAVAINSNTIRTAQQSDGISIGSGTTIQVISTDIATTGGTAVAPATGTVPGARGIVLGGTGNGIAYTSASVTSGTIATTGNRSYGIFATPVSGTTAIASRSITTTGATANGIYLTAIGNSPFDGATSISGGTIATSGLGARGIVVEGGSGKLDIAATDIRTTGNGGTAIQVTPRAGGLQPVTITADVIRTAGAGTAGIVVSGNSAGSVAVSVRDSATTGSAVDVRSAGTANVAAGTVRVTGAGAAGLVAISSAGQAIVSATDLAAANGAGIVAQGATGVSVTSATLAVAGTNTGIVARNSGAGSIMVSSTTLTSQAAGIDAAGAGSAVAVSSGSINAGTTAINASGATVTVDSRDIATAGTGILAGAGGAAAITSGAIRVAGTDRATSGGIVATGGSITIASTAIATSGTGTRFGIAAQVPGDDGTATGRLSITSGDIAAVGDGGFGILGITDAGALAIASTGTVRTTGNANPGGLSPYPVGIFAVSASGPISVASNSVATLGAVADGIRVEAGRGIASFPAPAVAGTAPISVTSTGAITTAGNLAAGIRVLGGDSAATITNRGTIATQGTAAFGILALGGSGAIGISSAQAATAGTGASAIRALTTSGAIGIAAADSRTAGTNADAIFARSTTGAITIDSNLAAASGLGSRGVVAQSDSGTVTITAGTTATTGAANTAANGTDASAVVGLSATGAVNVTSRIASTTGAGATAVLASSAGQVAILSGDARTSGAGATAVSGRSTAADVSIVAASAGTTGAGATAILGGADAGNVLIANNTVQAAAGTAIRAVAGGNATVSTLLAQAAGDGNAAVSATAGTGIGLTIAGAATTGASTASGRADAVFAQTTNGAIGATIGSASATGAGSDAVHLVAGGANGAVTTSVTGNLSSGTGSGLFVQATGATATSFAAGATSTGAGAGISIAGAANTITNAGALRGTAGPGILASGPTTLDNRGTIAGANGVAVQLGAADDSVTIRTGSSIDGRIVGGGGTDAAFLIGSVAVPSSGQIVPGFDGFDSLTVRSGFWTANLADPTTVATAIIDPGASLGIVNGANGIAGLVAATYRNNGALVVRDNGGSTGSAFRGSQVTGSGTVTFTGAGVATLDGTNTIASTGTITVDGGSRVVITGTQGGSFVTAPTGTLQIGTGGTTGNFTGSLVDNGQLIVNRSNDYLYAGALSGTGTLIKQGAGRLIFAGPNFAFAGVTAIQGGSIRLAATVDPAARLRLEGAGLVDLSGTSQTVAELSGSSRAITVDITGGALTTTQATGTVFSGRLVGDGGSFTKAGAGTLILDNASTYTGATRVTGGALTVTGSLASAVTVSGGGTLNGAGRIGGLTALAGGTVAPPGLATLAVGGSVAFAAGSTYAVAVTPAGTATAIAATGSATLTGGTVAVTPGAGTYHRLTDYTILTAAGGVTGQFAGVTSSLAFLSPLLRYGSNAVTLTLARNDLAFVAAATTANQRAVAAAVEARGPGDAVYNAVLFQTGLDAPTTFDQLDGEIYAALSSELSDNGRRVRDAVLERGLVRGDGIGVWGSALQSYARSHGQAGVSRLRANRTGGVGGIDYGRGALRIGAFGGYQDDDVVLRGRASSASVDTVFAGANVALDRGGFQLQAGASYAWHDIAAQRALTVPGLAGTLTGRPDGHTAQAFAEIGYPLAWRTVTLTPFVRNAYVATRIDGFAETGAAPVSAAALTGTGTRRDLDIAGAGLRLGGTAAIGGATLLPHLAVAYQRGFGDLRGQADLRIGGTGPSFAIAGAALARDAGTVDGGFDLTIGRGFTLGVAGFGSTAKRWSDRGIRGSVGFRF